MAARMEFDFKFTQPKPRAAFREDGSDSIRILVLGDFSGRDSRGVIEPGEGIATRPISTVDVDTFDSVLGRVSPALLLRSGGSDDAGTSIAVGRLEDLHPDALVDSLELMGPLRALRRRLLDPSTFEETAAELRRRAAETGRAGSGPAGPDGESTSDLRDGSRSGRGAGSAAGPEGPQTSGEDDVAILERLFGKRPADTRARAGGGPGAVDISRFLENIVGPHVRAATDPDQARLVGSVDEALSQYMRAVLHHPSFQALEANWRALHWLVTNVETDEDLRISLFDVSKTELASDLASIEHLEGSGLHRALTRAAAGAERGGSGRPWSLLLGAYTFGAGPDDLHLLAALGAIASQAGGPFIAGADPALAGCRSVAETPDPADWSQPSREIAERWRALRRSPSAAWIGLALPRFLLRLPYGAKTDAVERFRFEEMEHGRDHEAYLWGNPAFACARLIAEAFRENGAGMQPGDVQEIGDLPAHTTTEAGEARMQACAEAFLGERAATALLDRGLMPLLSFRDRNAARLARFQSIADPPAPLSGPWQ